MSNKTGWAEFKKTSLLPKGRDGEVCLRSGLFAYGILGMVNHALEQEGVDLRFSCLDVSKAPQSMLDSSADGEKIICGIGWR